MLSADLQRLGIFEGAAVQAVLAMLCQPLPPSGSAVEPLSEREGILLEGVHSRCEAEQREVLNGLDLLMGSLAPSAVRV